MADAVPIMNQTILSIPPPSINEQKQVRGIRIKVIFQEERRLCNFASMIQGECELEPVVRVCFVGKYWARSPDVITSLVSSMLSTVPNVFPHNRPRIADQVSMQVRRELSTRPMEDSLEILSWVYFRTTEWPEMDYHYLVEHDDVPRHEEEDDDDDVMMLQDNNNNDDDNNNNNALRRSIENLPSKAYAGDDCCAVCLEEFSPGGQVLEMPCSHFFHNSCIVPWLLSKGTCPSCRFLMPTDD